MGDEKTTKEVETFRFVADREDDGERIDVVLARHVPGLSRRRARILLGAGSVYLDGSRTQVLSRRVRAGASLECHENPFATASTDALDPARILLEDGELLAIDKLTGIPSHPTLARKQGTALQLLEECLRRREGRKVPLWPVHRLDTGTSGILLFAKTRPAARSLGEQLARREVRKLYVALVAGRPIPPEGEIALPLRESELRTEVRPEGREARTRYRSRQVFEHATLLEAEPDTGRMHQIRAHLAAVGHPIVGDGKYGGPEHPRLCLHASRLDFRHPADGRPTTIESPAPLHAFVPPEVEPVRNGG